MILLAAIAGLLAVSPNSFNRGTDRGVFVYGHLVLDFQQESEVMGLGHRLRNCSTNVHFCADGELFNIVLPKVCGEVRPDTVWRSGNLVTSVLGKRLGWQHLVARPRVPIDEVYYVHTNERPEIVYAYSPMGGVLWVYYDPRGQVDFVEVAREDRLDELQTVLMEDASREHMVLGLLTLDTFAECRQLPKSEEK